MKTIKILLGIIAINLTLLTIIQTGVWPPKVQASETNYSNILFDGSAVAIESGGYVYSWGSPQIMYEWVSGMDTRFPPKRKKLP